MLNKVELGLIALVRTALTQQPIKLPEGLTTADLMPMIKKHQIAPMILHALSAYELPDKEFAMHRLLQISGFGLSILESQVVELQKICEAFDEAKIDYAILKGMLLKDLYPHKDYRTMADVDVLVRRSQYDKIAEIMTRFGYTAGTESDHEYNWQKNYVHIELHKSLIPSYDEDYYAYFGDGWGLMKPIDGKPNSYAMSDEDQFIYLFTHYAKHFRDGGIGIKHLTDLWIFKKAKPAMDEKRIVQELKKLKLDEFYQNVMRTTEVWLEGAEATPITELMSHEILSNGAYGKEITRKRAEVIRNAPTEGKRSKLRWVLGKIFLPYKNMCMKYPFLKKLPFLLPIMWVVRWFAALFIKPKETKKNVALVRNMSQESVDEYREYLASLGLSFDAKE